jgi:hypothetical protein
VQKLCFHSQSLLLTAFRKNASVGDTIILHVSTASLLSRTTLADPSVTALLHDATAIVGAIVKSLSFEKKQRQTRRDINDDKSAMTVQFVSDTK